MPQVSSITQAIHASGITPTGLADLLLQVDSEASASTKARITVILDGLCNLPLTEGRKILTETAKQAKDTAQERTVKQRVSECRQLYGAVKLLDGFRAMIESKGMGWSPAVSAARLHLEQKGIKADGGKIVSPEQRITNATEAHVSEAIKAELLVADANDTRTVGELAEHARTTANEKMFAERVTAHANRIMKAEGKDYGLALADALMVWEPAEK